MKKLLQILFFLIFSHTIMYGQVSVKGKVTSADDLSGLPGVTVTVMGAAVGTITNADGEYNISVAEDATLVFSFVGYQSQEIAVANQSSIDVVLQLDIETLSEVVVIGYGEVEKKDITGAISTLGTKDFNPGVMTSPQDLMLGRIAGVQVTSNDGSPGAGATIRIRGGSSLGGATNDPLYVVDGVPLDDGNISGLGNPLSTINPNDIESFTVLKDASAAAIYGSRASNGVIIVTTKKGTSGKLKWSYNGQVSISQPIKYVDVLDGDEYRTLINGLVDEGFSGIDANAAARMGAANTDWQDEIFRNAISNNHSVGVSGTISEVLPFRATYGYTNQQGILETTESKRHTVSLNLNPTMLDDHLKVNLNARGALANTNFGVPGAIGNAVSFDPTQSIMNGNTRYKGYFQWTEELLPDGSMDPEGIATTFTDNPLSALHLRDNVAEVKRLTGNLQFDYKLHFFPDLSVNVNLGLDRSETVGRDDYLPGSTFTFRQYNSEDGRLRDYTNTTKSDLFESYLNYTKDFDKHSVNATVGYSYQNWERGSTTFDRSRDGSVVIEDTRYFHSGETDSIPTDNANQNLLISLYGRLIYSYDNRYTLTATVRQDGSSRFIGDNQKGLFPSLAVAWNLSEEAFLQNASTISNLKLRLGYGVTGQQGLDPNNGDLASAYYPALAQYTLGTGFSNYPIGPNGAPVRIARPEPYDANLKWEETTTLNIGVDFGLWSERLTGSVEVYKRETEDLLNLVPVADGSNFGNFVVSNVGNMDIKGYEITLTGRPISRPDFSWTISANLMYNKRTITKLNKTDDPSDPGVATGTDLGLGRRIQIHSVGQAPNSFYTFQQVYDIEGNPIEGVFVDRTGEGGDITANEFNKYHNHTPDPDYLVGINSRIAYKKFDASFSGRMSLGNYVYNAGATQTYAGLYSNDIFFNNIRSSAQDIGFRTGAGDLAFSDLYVQNASFFKMDNISVGYTFDQLVDGLVARLGFTVQNAFIITDYEGLDPEVQGGVDNNIYPRPRTYLFSLNLNF
ncbi:MAG: SusC/RagA family TonB-linked outer membrane protein [Reichenbachiella sp.]